VRALGGHKRVPSVPVAIPTLMDVGKAKEGKPVRPSIGVMGAGRTERMHSMDCLMGEGLGDAGIVSNEAMRWVQISK
jgi:hypothetical protein